MMLKKFEVYCTLLACVTLSGLCLVIGAVNRVGAKLLRSHHLGLKRPIQR